MRVSCLLLLVLAACAKAPPAPPPPAPVVVEWLELNDQKLQAELRSTPQELAQPPFAPWQANQPRLLRYDYPQVRRLTLPADGVRRDVAFFDIGGRVIDLYEGASCQPASTCSPLPARFPAASVLIAPPGTLARFQVKRATQMRWYEAPPAPAQVFPLPG